MSDKLIKPKQPKGIQPRKCKTVQLASTDIMKESQKPVPPSQIQAIPQSFSRPNQLTRPKETRPKETRPKKTRTKEPKEPKESKEPKEPKESKEPKEQKEPNEPPTTRQKVTDELQAEIDTKPILKDYQTKQDEFQSKNPYVTDTEIYTPQSRKSFYKFISNTYRDFKLIPQIKGKIDEDACAKLGAAAKDTVEAFLYQKFIREYIRNASPYRGILVYHGLGSGKTCSAIAAAEAIYGTSNKKIIVMTPFSLRGNFMSEISFCGFRHFNVRNHWVSEPLGEMTYMYAKSVLSMSETYLKEVLKRPEDRKVIWIPDFTNPSNFDDLTQQQRDDIRAQITNIIENRITFLSYNGITASKLKKYACEKGERFFDNAVIVIDEIHNLTRLMQGEITPYIAHRAEGRPRKIPVEPIVPGKWKPGLCNSDMNYKRSYLFYKLLTDARNSKIIGLSGTPIINFPDELGVLANILAGYTECVEFDLKYRKVNKTIDDAFISEFTNIIESEPRVDMVRLYPLSEKFEVLVSFFNEGYEKVNDDEFVGVKYNAESQEDIRTIFGRIKSKLGKYNCTPEKFVSYPRLPIDDKIFRDEFIDPVKLSVKNKIVLQKRLTGLISYYKGSKEEYMPRVTKDEVVKCEMSDYVLSKYTEVRKKEIEGEKGKKADKGDKYAAVEEFSKMKNPSNYRFRSRALCNFTFPPGITRPFPDTVIEEVVDLGDLENEIITDEVIDDLGDVEKEEKEEKEEVDDIYEDGKLEKVEEEEVQIGKGREDVEIVTPVNPATPVKKKRPTVAPTPVPPVPTVPVPVVPPVTPVKKRRPMVAPKIIQEEKEEEKEEKEEQTVRKVLSYQESIKKAMNTLDAKRTEYLMLDSEDSKKRVTEYSTKIDKMIRNILKSKGSNLVYSQFKTVEGLGVLGLALKANGFVEIEIEGGDWAPKASKVDNTLRFSDATIKSFEDMTAKRFMFLTGDGLREKRNLILNIFNGQFDKIPDNMRKVLEKYSERKNMYGEICWIFGITGAGAEGISLKCCRSVHIMEPYWNKVRSDQVKGRAIRICSHQDLPYKEREVEIYTYYTIFSKKQMKELDESIRHMDKGDKTDDVYNIETSDENVYNVGVKKDIINQELLDLMKESAMDCGLNTADNHVKCFEVVGHPKQYLFDPKLEIDKTLTSIQIKVKEEKVEKGEKGEKGEKKEEMSIKSDRDTAQVVRLRRGDTLQEYIIYPKSGGIYNIYERSDTRDPIGELAINPATGTFKGSKPVFKI